MLNHKDRAMVHQQSSTKNTSVAISIGLILLILFGYMFATALWQYSAVMINNVDSFIYLRTGLHLAWGDGLGIYRYYADTDSVRFVFTSHYPPLTSLTYSILAQLGNLSPSMLPVIVSLIGWVTMLAGIGVFTYQQSKSPLLAVLTIILPATSFNLWFIFLHAMSEPIFLPLLIWLMVLTYNLPQREQGRGWRFIGVVLVLMLMMLTRYVGVIVLAAVMLWWVWHWWYTPNRKLSRLLGESTILAASALPLATFIIYAKLQTIEQTVGKHFTESEYTFTDGAWEMLLQSGSIFLPNFQVATITEWIGWYGWIVYGVLGLLLLGLLWYLARTGKIPSWRTPHTTPALLFILGYVALYTIVQPFLNFYPMDWRYIAAVLCLTIPLIAGAIGSLPVRWSYMVLIGYIGLNVLFLVAQEQIHSAQAEEYSSEQVQASESASSLDHSLADQEDLVAWVQTLPQDHILLTNDPGLLVLHTRSVIEDIALPHSFNAVVYPQAWLDAGSCRSQYSVSIVLFSWDNHMQNYHLDAKAIQQAVERKCPDLPKRQLEHSVVYTLRRE